MKAVVIGAGLAGSEAAYYLARKGVEVLLYEMKPKRFSPAHESENFCELVCSNSLKSDDVFGNASGLLKEEMRRLGSLVLEAADSCKVPAGGALAVDREKFSAFVTAKLRAENNIKIVAEEIGELPEEGIVATGPLTDGKLYEAIRSRFGGGLHFYDASAPIVSRESVDFTNTFTADRYGRGEGDYINCPMTKEQYEIFVAELVSAEKAVLHDFEKGEIFEGCMPVEVMASRGKDTLRYGTFKPVGLFDGTGARPYAVLQLRKENAEGSSLGLVGCQTNLKFGEQKRVFSLIPALKNAEFERYGVMHRNTYLESPEILDEDFSVKENPMLFFAGQMTGVEGYIESAASGLLAAIHYLRKLKELPPVRLGDTCVSGALSQYIARKNKDFAPMNANYGILRELGERDKKIRKQKYAERALEEIGRFICGIGG